MTQSKKLAPEFWQCLADDYAYEDSKLRCSMEASMKLYGEGLRQIFENTEIAGSIFDVSEMD